MAVSVLPFAAVFVVVVILTTTPSTCAAKCAIDQIKAEILNVDSKILELYYRISNAGNKDICVLDWNIPLDRKWWSVSLTLFKKIDSNKADYDDTAYGEREDYARPVVPLRFDIKDSDYRLIRANSGIEGKLDLLGLFAFDEGETYAIWMTIRPTDCYTTKGQCTKRVASEMYYPKFRVNLSTLTVIFKANVDGDVKHGYDIENWLDHEKRGKKRRTGNVVTFGSTEDQHNTIVAVHAKVKDFFRDAIEVLKVGKSDIYTRWFGAYIDARYKIVTKNIKECAKEVNKVYMYHVRPNEVFPKDSIAFVDNALSGDKQHLINVGLDFFDAKTTSDAEKAHTILHEMTHDTANTFDYADRDCKSKKLAKTKPAEAIKNADNYAYFCRDAYKTQEIKRKKANNLWV